MILTHEMHVLRFVGGSLGKNVRIRQDFDDPLFSWFHYGCVTMTFGQKLNGVSVVTSVCICGTQSADG